MFKKKRIKVTVKLYSGLHKDAELRDYDPYSGIVQEVNSGTRVRKIVKDLGIPQPYSLAYFINGERVGLWKKIHDGDELSCFRPSGGG